MCLGEFDDLIGILDRISGAGHLRGADLLGDVARRHLVTEGFDRCGRGPDPHHAGVHDGLREVRVLGQEAIPGVHRVGAGALRDGDDLVDVQIGLGRCGAVERERLVGHLDEQRRRVGVGVDGHAFQPGIPGATDDPHRDLATIGNEHLRDGASGVDSDHNSS